MGQDEMRILLAVMIGVGLFSLLWLLKKKLYGRSRSFSLIYQEKSIMEKCWLPKH